MSIEINRRAQLYDTQVQNTQAQERTNDASGALFDEDLSVDDIEMLYDTTELAEEAEALAEDAEISIDVNSSDFSLENIDALNEELQRVIDTANRALDELEERQEALEREQAVLDEQTSEYNDTLDDINDKQEEFDELQDAINKAVEDYEKSDADNKRAAINKAMAEYDPNKDGDWNAYLQEELKGVVGDSSFKTLIADLEGTSSSTASELASLQITAESQKRMVDASTAIVTGIQNDIALLEETITVSEASMQVLREKILEAITNSISPEEMALVEENNIDLSEKLPDGSPKYIFAKGKEDGKYHIYEMNEDGTSASSLARRYAPDGGYDIIASGNGNLNGLQKSEGDCPEGESIYYIGDCGTACSFKGSYSTCSPLSFDLNGDGVQLSDEVIDYDIDGDGIVDKINDSADAVLVFDSDGDGISGEDGSECFGNNTDLDGDGVKDGFSDGFAALKSLAFEAGVIDGADDIVLDSNDLKTLEEQYGLKIKTDGYNSFAQSLSDVGITEINLADTDETTLVDNVDGNGNQIMYQDGATFTVNGEEREYADIWHRKLDE